MTLRRFWRFWRSTVPGGSSFPVTSHEIFSVLTEHFETSARPICCWPFAGQLVGTLGAWDQHGFRQNVVHRYNGLTHWTRPLYNAWCLLSGSPALPGAGQPFRHLTAVRYRSSPTMTQPCSARCWMPYSQAPSETTRNSCCLVFARPIRWRLSQSSGVRGVTLPDCIMSAGKMAKCFAPARLTPTVLGVGASLAKQRTKPIHDRR